MGVEITLKCDGCEAGPVEGGQIQNKFRSVSGRSYGIGSYSHHIDWTAPDGWIPFDPYTQCAYCPACWAEIIKDD